MQWGGRLQWQKAITDMNVCQTWVLVWSQISISRLLRGLASL